MKMTRMLFIIVAPLFVISLQAKGQCQELVWADEFNTGGLPDSNFWSYNVGGGGWGNNELQYYTYKRSENARVENGKLIIEARREKYQGMNYTSARLVTKMKGDWLYGTVEVKAKLPAGRGTWPAIWMLPTDSEYGSWPKSGEIDIMEHVGYDEGNVHATIHTEAYNHTLGTQKGAAKMVEDATDTFHVYKAIWAPDKIEFFIDETKYFTFRNNNTTYKAWPFDKRFHLVLNIAVGGNWGGAQGIDTTCFPARMEIEYVRIYQSPENLTIHGPDNAVPLQEDLHFFLVHDQEAGYSWSLTGNGEFLSSTDSSAVNIRWGCGPDTLRCHVTTACSEYELKHAIRLSDYTIEGPMFVEPLQENILLTAPLTGDTDFSWDVPADAVIQSGQDNDSLLLTWGESHGNVKLTMENSCGTFEVNRMFRFYGQYAYPDPDSPHRIPGSIRLTDYDYGGEGLAYHDAEITNKGTGPRKEEGVDTEFGDNGNANVGWISAGEWMEFTIKVAEDDVYQAGIRVASSTTPRGPLRLLINGEERIPDIAIPSTGSWSNFTTIYVNNISFYTTDTLLRLYAVNGGFNLSTLVVDTFLVSTVRHTEAMSVRVYPNPAGSFATIIHDEPIREIILTDFTGKILQVIKTTSPLGSLELDLSAYPAGLLLVHVLDRRGDIQVIKLAHRQ